MGPAIDLPARVLLTSLFDSLAEIEPAESSTIPPTSTFSNAQLNLSNPLRLLPAPSRNLFLTAHCLLPTTFLAALDLLEKSLVERYTTSETPSLAPQVYYIRSNPPPPQSLAIPGPNFSSTASFKPAFPKSAKSYVYEVRPAIWNCTCIAFTLAAYQKQTGSRLQNMDYGLEDGEDEEDNDLDSEKGSDEDGDATGGGDDETEDVEREGGLEEPAEYEGEGNEMESEDGPDENLWYGGIYTLDRQTTSKRKTKRSDVPVCKHLLAAVLAEKCSRLFGGYVVEKFVTIDEMAEMAVLWE